jgi:chromosome partitioning protein
MGTVVAIIQNKGGVGKTTVTCNLGAAYARRFPEKKALIIDLDPQGNQASSFGLKPDQDIQNTIYDVLVNNVRVKDAIIPLISNLDLLPSNDDMNYYELDTLPGITDVREYLLALKKVIDPIKNDYDYIFIDSPPELKIIAACIMLATDEIFIPFEPDAYNADGLTRLLSKIEHYKNEYNAIAEIKVVIPMKIKKNTVLHKGILEQVREFCEPKGIKVSRVMFPNSIKYPEYIAMARMPIIWADPNGIYSKLYFDLLDEVIENG